MFLTYTESPVWCKCNGEDGRWSLSMIGEWKQAYHGGTRYSAAVCEAIQALSEADANRQ